MNDIRDEQREFTRGLEGVVAAESSISYVDGVHGRLLYQGYDIHDLAEHTSFEETVFLLWRGWLPTRPELEAFQSELVAEMRLPSQVTEMLKLTPPSSHPMAVLRTAVSMLANFDPDAENNSRRPTGARPSGWWPRCRPSSPTCTASARGCRCFRPTRTSTFPPTSCT